MSAVIGRPITTALAGQRFGKLTVLERLPSLAGSGTRWLCECTCGTQTTTRSEALTSGKTTQCRACGRRGRPSNARTHGLTGTPTYKTWQGMWRRVTNPNEQNWDRYGGRGITVCDRWRAFPNFLEDMGEKPPGLSIDRINNDGNYEPGNCRWATAEEQRANRRPAALRSMCRNGHPMTPDNFYLSPYKTAKGEARMCRRCRTCVRENAAKREGAAQ